MGKFNYPKRILPRKKYKLKIDFDKYLHTKKFILIRRTDKPQSYAFDELGTLRIDALINNLQDVQNMSVNLLGAKYRLQYLGYIPKGDATNTWVKKKCISIKSYKNSVEYNSNVYPIYFILNDIVNHQFQYKRKKDKEYLKIYKEKNSTVPEGDYIFSTGIIEVIHIPIVLNYWHAEFRLKDIIDNKIVKKVKSHNGGFNSEYWQNQLVKSALENVLSVKAKPEFPEHIFTKIKRKIYCDK